MNAPETAAAADLSHQFLLGELVRASSKRFKALEVPFNRLERLAQEVLLQEIAEDCRRAVRQAIDAIASDYRPTLNALVETVQFKADGVKGTLSLANSEAAHSLADYAGRTVLLVIEDGARYLEAGDATRGEEDQRPLFDVSAEARR